MPLLEGWVGLLSPSLSLLLTLLTLLSPSLSLLLTLLLCSQGEVVFNRGRHALITLPPLASGVQGNQSHQVTFLIRARPDELLNMPRLLFVGFIHLMLGKR